MRSDLVGLCTTYVDNALYFGNKELQEPTKKIETKLKCEKRGRQHAVFWFKNMKKLYDFLVHQNRYISKLTSLQKSVCSINFQSLRPMFPWTTNSRTDIFCAVALMAQVTEKIQNEPAKYINRSSNVLTHLPEHPELFL